MKEYRLPLELFYINKDSDVFYDKEVELDIKNKVECFFEYRGVESKVCKMVFGPTLVTIGLTIDKKVLPYQYYNLAKAFDEDFCLRGTRLDFDRSENIVYMEIQSAKRTLVDLGKILSEEELEAESSDNNQLKVALGKDYLNRTTFCDLLQTPNVFIGGAVGTGKSVLLNSMLLSLLYKSSPDDLKLLLLSPLSISLSKYSGLPHMITEEPVTDIDDCIFTLKQVREEINRRYELFSKNSVRNVEQYNLLKKNDDEKLYKLVVVIDDLAELLRGKKSQTESVLLSIFPKARAAGIYFIVSTANVLLAASLSVLLKSFSGRVLFRVSSEKESNVILEEGGAENLFGRGDYLYKDDFKYPYALRIQAPCVSMDGVAKIVEYIKENYPKT